MKLEKLITYKGKEYKVNFNLHNEKELNRQTIGAVPDTLIVSAQVLNDQYKPVYNVESKIDLSDKKSLVTFLKDTVKAAHDKENLEQVKMLDVWDGDIDKEIKEVNNILNGETSISKHIGNYGGVRIYGTPDYQKNFESAMNLSKDGSLSSILRLTNIIGEMKQLTK